MNQKNKILIILGPTASGKSSLAVSLAHEFDGEIISADSRQVYKGMDIGTGKITQEEMQGIKHHLIDVVLPNQRFSSAEWVKLAREKIEEIRQRGKLPIICGGTGFYIDTLLGRISIPNVEENSELRKELKEKTKEDLLNILQKLDSKRSESVDPNNKPRIIRAIEIAKALGHVPEQKESQSLYQTIEIGIETNKEKLKEKINKRLEDRMNMGMIEEVNNLIKNDVSHEKLQSFGLEYRYISLFIQGKINKDELIENLKNKIWQYARRQMTWWRKNKNIIWFKLGDKQKIIESLKDKLS